MNQPKLLQELPKLTSREEEIWNLYQDGKSSREIAALTGVRRSTIRTNLRRIKEKIESAEDIKS